MREYPLAVSVLVVLVFIALGTSDPFGLKERTTVLDGGGSNIDKENKNELFGGLKIDDVSGITVTNRKGNDSYFSGGDLMVDYSPELAEIIGLRLFDRSGELDRRSLSLLGVSLDDQGRLAEIVFEANTAMLDAVAAAAKCELEEDGQHIHIEIDRLKRTEQFGLLKLRRDFATVVDDKIAGVLMDIGSNTFSEFPYQANKNVSFELRKRDNQWELVSVDRGQAIWIGQASNAPAWLMSIPEVRNILLSKQP